MGIIDWLIVGIIAGFTSNWLTSKQGKGLLMDNVLGVAGAVIGGFVAQSIGFVGIARNLYTVVIATCGAVVVLLTYHQFRVRRTTG